MVSKNQVRSNSESGFSLIEVSIALTVIAILMVPIIRTYNMYLEQKRLAITNSVTAISKAAILKYYEKYGVYPTPANPSIAQGAPGFGVPVAGPYPVCTVASTVVCQTPNTGFGTGIVLIGDVPFAAVGIPFKSILDGYGRKLKYAVTLSQTTLPFNDASGAIEVLNSNAAPTSIYTNVTTPRSHFAVVSLGQNGVGAFTLAGQRSIACNTTVAPVPDESENCDNDGIFRSNIDQAAGSLRILRFDAAGARQFDDYLATTNTSSYGIWSFIPNTLQDMQSRNEGNVKIGACTAFPCVPNSHLEVDGNVSAANVQTSRICPSTESNCTTNIPAATPRALPTGTGFFSPTGLTGAPSTEPVNFAPTNYSAEGGTTGAGIRCYQDGALKGIRNYDEVCAQSTVSGSGITSSARFLSTTTSVPNACTGTDYAIGISINSAGTGFSWICGP